MSIIVSLLSKFALSKVKDYFKNNKKEFILFIIVLVCFCIISFMSLRLLYRKNQVSKLEDDIDNLEIKVERLEITNQLNIDNLAQLSNEIIAKKSFSDTKIKIIYITNDIYYTNTIYMSIMSNKRDDFYFNQIMLNRSKQ